MHQENHARSDQHKARARVVQEPATPRTILPCTCQPWLSWCALRAAASGMTSVTIGLSLFSSTSCASVVSCLALGSMNTKATRAPCVFGHLRIGPAHDGEQHPARLEHAPRVRLHITADRVEGCVHAVHDLLESLRRIVDVLIDAQAPEQLGARARPGRDHTGTFPLCQLHRQAADASGRPVN